MRAPSTLGTFLRLFTFGHVRQLDAVAARLLARLAAATPVLPGADQVVFVDIDDTVRQTYGYAKQGAGRGYTGVKGLNALLAVVSTPTSAPLIAATRLRKVRPTPPAARRSCSPTRWPPRRRAGAAGLVLVRADSAYYGYDIIAACRRAGARFSVTARSPRPWSRRSPASTSSAWTPIRYPNAIYDEDEQRWVSDAEVAEIDFTAFTGRRKAEHVTARLIVRRVRRLNPKDGPGRAARDCSRSTATTRCSPTAPNRCWPQATRQAAVRAQRHLRLLLEPGDDVGQIATHESRVRPVEASLQRRRHHRCRQAPHPGVHRVIYLGLPSARAQQLRELPCKRWP